MITKLLCAIDGSYPSDRAVDVAIHMARQLHVPLAFLTINPASADRTSTSHFWDDQVIAAIDAQLNKVLADAAAVARRMDFTDFTCVIAAGTNIASAIIDYARKNGFDHIVLASSRPSSALAGMFGSVAVEVVRRANCPVTVVH
jgi:nucleotide-binding universal stress UspA family protein